MYILRIREYRYLQQAAAAVEQNILLMENVLSGYRSLDPVHISKEIPKSYRPAPPVYYSTIEVTPSWNWITQPEINELVFRAAGRGSRSADPTALADMLQKCGEETISELGRKISPRRLQNLLHPSHPEHLIHRAKDGTWVRSKSEAAIIDILLSLHLSYRYEEPVLIGGKWLKIDFAIVLPASGRIIYLEHAGMIGDDQYRNILFLRLEWMIREGMAPDRDFFLTFDRPGGGTDFRMLEEKIRYILTFDN